MCPLWQSAAKLLIDLRPSCWVIRWVQDKAWCWGDIQKNLHDDKYIHHVDIMGRYSPKKTCRIWCLTSPEPNLGQIFQSSSCEIPTCGQDFRHQNVFDHCNKCDFFIGFQCVFVPKNRVIHGGDVVILESPVRRCEELHLWKQTQIHIY